MDNWARSIDLFLFFGRILLSRVGYYTAFRVSFWDMVYIVALGRTRISSVGPTSNSLLLCAQPETEIRNSSSFPSRIRSK